VPEEQLRIAAGTVLSVLSQTKQQLELSASYEAGGTAPPAHLHPVQDERFEVLAGAMRVRVAGQERELAAGEVLEIPRGTAHQMWNGSEEPGRMSWVTSPAGRTLEWLRELAALQAGEPLSDPETLLARYEDVFRLAG
jgi:quercetin dioxygenase-like cupin family protein